jgi:glycosyltransferase involved in cell wall biosynthesis
MKILIVSAQYPGPDLIYGDVFVHTRVKAYRLHHQVSVAGFNENIKQDRKYTYEGVDVEITNNLQNFYDAVRKASPDIIAVHMVQRSQVDFFTTLSIPVVVFAHGYEITSWRRRVTNFDTLGSIRYLVPYIVRNELQLRKLRKLVRHANAGAAVQFVFVSRWLQRAAEEDLGVSIKKSMVIPNGINTRHFDFVEKSPEIRKKILIVRSFKARNYANDIAIDAIVKLSRKPYFQDLEFSIYGEGYLFKPLTGVLRSFPNVKLYNFFIENKDIAAIHKEFGLFLCPSRMDTQGVSMCEAMASGLVPITSPIGGIPEYAEDGQSAFMTNDADGIVKYVEQLYNDPDLFVRISRQAREAVLRKCSLDETITREISLFESLLHQ